MKYLFLFFIFFTIVPSEDMFEDTAAYCLYEAYPYSDDELCCYDIWQRDLQNRSLEELDEEKDGGQ